MSERISSPNRKKPNYRLRQGVAAIALGATGLAVGAGIVKHYEEPLRQIPESSKEMTDMLAGDNDKDIFPSNKKRVVKVRNGEGVDDLIQRVYGIEAPEGTNQVVQNNPTYEAEYGTIVKLNGGNEDLQVGTKLKLPADFYLEGEVPATELPSDPYEG